MPALGARSWHFRDYAVLSPAVRLIHHLRISTKSEEWGSNYLGLLSQSAYACELRTLTIKSCELYAGVVAKLLASTAFSKLESIEVTNTLLGGGELRTLLRDLRVSVETRRHARLGRLGRLR